MGSVSSDSVPVNLTFLAFGRIQDGALLGLYNHPTAQSDIQYTEETFQKILHAAKIRLQPGGRQKLMWGQSAVSIMLNHPAGDLLYGVVATSFDYPERLTYQLLNELADQVESTFSSDQLAKADEFSLTEGLDLARLLRRYQDPVTIDRLASVQKKTDSLRDLMQSNIRDIMKNTEAVDVLQTDVESMEVTAQQYKEKASELKDYYWWKDLKMQLLIVALVIFGMFLLLWSAGVIKMGPSSTPTNPGTSG